MEYQTEKKMELVKLFQALYDAATIKAGFALLGAYFIELLGPALEFVVFGVLVLIFEILTGVLANIKAEAKATANGAEVIFKIALYPICIFMAAIVEYQWVPVLPLTAITSGYIVVHEFEQSLQNVSTLTGWDLTGPVKMFKDELKKRGWMK